MRYRWRDIPALFATPVGRAQLIEGINYRLWPVSSRLARVYRRTLVRRTRVVVIVGSSGKSTTVRAVAAAIDLPPADTLLYNAWGSISRAMLRIAVASATRWSRSASRTRDRCGSTRASSCPTSRS